MPLALKGNARSNRQQAGCAKWITAAPHGPHSDGERPQTSLLAHAWPGVVGALPPLRPADDVCHSGRLAALSPLDLKAPPLAASIGTRRRAVRPAALVRPLKFSRGRRAAFAVGSLP